MRAMVAVWAVFTLVLYVSEPLFLHRWYHERTSHDPEGAFCLVRRLHVLLPAVSIITIGGAVIGVHGGF